MSQPIYPNRYTILSDIRKKDKLIESCGIICRYIHHGEIYVLVVKGQIGQKWGLPKGNKYENETEKECAIRETFEETGLVIDLDSSSVRVPLTRNVYFIHTFSSIKDVNFYNRCLSPSILPKSQDSDSETDEIEDVRWMTLSQLQKRRELCNKDLKTITSDKDLWFIHKIFNKTNF